MELDYDFGGEYLDVFLSLPRRAQEFALAYLHCENNKEYLKDNLFGYSERPYASMKSPIEKIFAIAFYTVLNEHGFLENEIFSPIPQAEISLDTKTYYADFLILAESFGQIKCENEFKLVIECDGHDFHEKTKEQVAYRNERDLELMSAGYDVMHFSGSQIYKDPYKIANQVYEYLSKKVGRVWYEEG